MELKGDACFDKSNLTYATQVQVSREDKGSLLISESHVTSLIKDIGENVMILAMFFSCAKDQAKHKQD